MIPTRNRFDEQIDKRLVAELRRCGRTPRRGVYPLPAFPRPVPPAVSEGGPLRVFLGALASGRPNVFLSRTARASRVNKPGDPSP